jgi:hypothetical protein
MRNPLTMETTTMPETSYAVLGVFETPDALMKAIPKVRASQLGTVEAYTPYPIHGIDEALGLRRSPLGGMVLVMGILGALTAFGFQYWISAVDYPIITGGKAVGSWEAFIPIMFEVTVLFATFTAGLGMLLLLNRLPFFGHPVLSSKAITGITRDRYALALEAESEAFDAAAAARKRAPPRWRSSPPRTAAPSSPATTSSAPPGASSPPAWAPAW